MSTRPGSAASICFRHGVLDGPAGKAGVASERHRKAVPYAEAAIWEGIVLFGAIGGAKGSP